MRLRLGLEYLTELFNLVNNNPETSNNNEDNRDGQADSYDEDIDGGVD